MVNKKEESVFGPTADVVGKSISHEKKLPAIKIV